MNLRRMALCVLLIIGAHSALSAAPVTMAGLFKATSKKQLLESAANQQWSLPFYKRNRTDTVQIIALRVAFQVDESDKTTGNGLFVTSFIVGENRENSHYFRQAGQVSAAYKFDNLPHDSAYFDAQLQFAQNYFATVSRGKFWLNYRVFPSGTDRAYSVPHAMTYYSPPGRRKDESYDNYAMRKTMGIMRFVKDALAAASAASPSPFATCKAVGNKLVDTLTGHSVAVLIFHAGSSFLTDGGVYGSAAANTPGDMIDWFITPETFTYFKDSLGLAKNGVEVAGANGAQVLIDEVMNVSETSNQDSLNWGIHGVLVNQIARQIGIPDLFSTTSGLPAVGAFCIMDFYGYSAGNGFIPPWPSAWVRAFMGWDNVAVAQPGNAAINRIKAVSSAGASDTAILMVPLNDHEYYLIENRQRNVAHNDSMFKFDTTEKRGGKPVYLDPYDHVNIDSNITARSAASNSILSVRNYDVSLPASGVCVWRVDEQVIRNRLQYNLVNADSNYRGVTLVEADGVNDLGITFADMFYNPVYNPGGAADVFPHKIYAHDSATIVTGLSPFGRPSTRSSDGGHTWLSIGINPQSAALNAVAQESVMVAGGTITNYVDSFFLIDVRWDRLKEGWPKRAVADTMLEPVVCNVSADYPGSEVVALDRHGRLYVYAQRSAGSSSLGSRTQVLYKTNVRGDTLRDSTGAVIADTIIYCDSLSGVRAFPTVVNNQVFVPCSSGIYVLSSVAANIPTVNTITLSNQPSSYVCNYAGNRWAVGCNNGSVIFGNDIAVVDSISLPSTSPVCAIAALSGDSTRLAVVQVSGALSVIRMTAVSVLVENTVTIPGGIGPYTLVTGDCNRDDTAEIVVCDSRHGTYLYSRMLVRGEGWQDRPNDWANAYTDVGSDRTKYPVNHSAPALADINNDGRLDIVLGGTNGLYAFNYKGALISGWPAYLDKRYWYLRKSVAAAPVVARDVAGKPLTLFSSPTGENVSFVVTKIDSVNRSRGMVYFTWPAGGGDSVSGVTVSLIDTLLTIGDSLITPGILPGGTLDAVNDQGKRPVFAQNVYGAGLIRQSAWPFTIGTPSSCAPVLCDLENNDTLDVVVVSNGGMVYAWQLEPGLVQKNAIWPQTGNGNSRTFAWNGLLPAGTPVENEALTFFNYPNPVQGVSQTTFKYKFSAPATNVRLEIFTYTGFSLYAVSGLSGSFPDWNEHAVSMNIFGPGVYRCRMEAVVNGVKQIRYWKMAVIK